jgi:mRNA export factor
LHDPTTQQTQQIGTHDQPVRSIRWVEAANASPILATASWDKTLKYWDCRQPNPIGVVNLPERAYAMDSMFPLLIVGTAERHVCLINLNTPMQIYKTMQSPLKYQTRCITAFPIGRPGFAISSIEGRVAMHYVEDKDQRYPPMD